MVEEIVNYKMFVLSADVACRFVLNGGLTDIDATFEAEEAIQQAAHLSTSCADFETMLAVAEKQSKA